MRSAPLYNSSHVLLSEQRLGCHKQSPISNLQFKMTVSAEEQIAPTPATDRPALIGPVVRSLTPTEFNTAMVHLYRGEVGRANTWRTRLDGTTNWAVLTTLTTLSFAFSSAKNTH